uniref:RRM domain-containing protein n=1 Tax=Peronospora matthiolae TaxID=2874970 RepID=A0AAV1U7P3_9STRA
MNSDEKEFLREWLILNLEPVSDADPEVLSKYVLALVQQDPRKPGLQDTCVSKLDEFLGEETTSFVAKLFKALADGSYKGCGIKNGGPSDEKLRAVRSYDDDNSRQYERNLAVSDDEQRRFAKRRRDDDRPRESDFKRHQGSPRRDGSYNRRQPYPLHDPVMHTSPMGGRGVGPYGMGGDHRRNFPMEWGMPPQGMWPPHFPPPRGAGYPPEFDQNGYVVEKSSMMPPPHMMMPHPMGGRGQFFAPGGRGGRGGPGQYYPGRGGRDRDNGDVPTAKTTLYVRHVDPKYVNMTMLSLHFSKFGNVVNVRMRPSAKCAFVQYATEEEAKKAFHSPLPVCNNRFISVKWAKHDTQSPGEAGDVGHADDASRETPGVNGVPADSAATVKIGGEADDEGELINAKSEKSMTTEELRVAALEKGRLVLEQKRELLEKQRAIKKQKEGLIKRQLAQQKELLERMSFSSSQFSLVEKRDLLNKITALSEELKALTPRHSAVSPNAATPQAISGRENLNGLKEELSALEAEASGGSGGRGGRWSAGRGYRGGRGGRGRGGYGRGSHTLDNRTTIVKVANLPEEACDPVVLTQHFGNFGTVERVVMDESFPGLGYIKFQDRYAGQAALSHGNVFADKQLEMAWVESHDAPAELTRSDSPKEAAVSTADSGATGLGDQVSACA